MGLLGTISSALGNVAGVMSPIGTIAGGVSALGSLFGRSPEDKAMELAKLQHQWDIEENQKNRDFQRDEWTRQFDAINAYNNPSATKNRLINANLNASAILNGSGASVGNSTASPSVPSGAHGLNPLPDVISQVGFQSRESLMKRLQILGDMAKSSSLLPETKQKLSAEVQNIVQDTKFKEVKTEVEDYMLRLDQLFKPSERWFGLEQNLADIAKAYAEMKLSIKNGELIDEEKINKAVERLLLHAKKNLTDAEYSKVQKELDWIDVEKKQAIKESKSRETSNYASANEANTQADVNRENRRIQSALADIEESGKSEKIKTLIKKYQNERIISDKDAEEANLKLDRILQIEDKRSTFFFKEIDGFTEWLKSKMSIFH